MNRLGKWDDLRIVLAIATSGSLSGAGRSLGLSHATVFRRLGELEERLGVQLFERGRSGYSLTAAGEDVAAAVRRIESEVLDTERRVAGRDLRPSGTLRVTTTDSLLIGLLSPLFAEFCAAYPSITLEVVVSNLLFNLSKREADVAIRPSSRPPEALTGRKVATIAQAVYGPPDLVSKVVANDDLRGVDWIASDERMAYWQLDQWMAAQKLQERCRYRVDTILGMHSAAREGLGLAVLPCYLGDADGEIVRAGEPLPELASDLWLLTHPDLRKVARVRAFLDFAAQALRGMQATLSGEFRRAT